MTIRFESFFSAQTRLMRASEIRDLLKLTEGRDVISLAGGLPDPETFPREEIKKILEDIMSNNWREALQYSATAGVASFRKELASFSETRGIKGQGVSNVFVSTGSQEALFMIAQLLIDPGDYVIVESPTYLAALNAFRTRSPRFEGVPIEEDGMDIEVLESKLKRIKAEGSKVKMIYTIPTAQNPGGVTMTYQKRKALIEMASRYDTLIVEDDAYGHLVFEGESPPAIKALDKEERVIYTSTFSKILSPGFRLGWVLAEEEFIRELELMKQNVDLHTSTFTQYIAAEALRRNVVQNNLPRIRQIYREKRDVMIEALQDNFPGDTKWSRPVGGMFVFAWVSQKLDTAKLLPTALERGVAYVPGSSFFHDFSGKNTMRLNFSFPTKEQLKKGIQLLGSLLKEFS
jgi:2-aminoadipate transaminase